MGWTLQLVWTAIVPVMLALVMATLVCAADELEVFAGQDKNARVQVALEFNDARIVRPDPLDPGKTYTFSWDFDTKKDTNLDGIFDNDAESTEMFTQWIYWMPGYYTVTLTVDDGEFTAKDTLIVCVVPNEPPEIFANDTEKATVDKEHTFNARATDDVDPPHLLRWHWDFGDGTSTDGPPPVKHTYQIARVYTVTVRVTDADKDWTEHVISLEVLRKSIFSTINIAEGEWLEGEFTVAGTVTSDVPLDRVEVGVDDSAWTTLVDLPDWSYLMDTTALSFGNHTIEVRGWRGDILHEMVKVRFAVDNPPSVGITFPTGEGSYNGTLVANGTARDDAWIEWVEARVDTGLWKMVEGTDHWSLTIDTYDMDVGYHTLFVRGYDGTRLSEVSSIQFYVDQVPVVVIEEVEQWGVTPYGYRVRGALLDDDPEPLVEVSVDGGPWEEVPAGEPYGQMVAWAFEMDTTCLAMGDHTLRARAHDGHQFSDIATMVFHTDRPPEVTIDPLPEDREVRRTLVLTGTLTDDGEVEGIEYRIDGLEWTNFTVGENWSVDIPVNDLGEGRHSVEVRAWDGTQYSDTASVAFVVEQKEKDSPGFGGVLAVVALLFAFVAIASRRR